MLPRELQLAQGVAWVLLYIISRQRLKALMVVSVQMGGMSCCQGIFVIRRHCLRLYNRHTEVHPSKDSASPLLDTLIHLDMITAWFGKLRAHL